MNEPSLSLIICTDGGARGNPGPAGVGVVVKTTQGETLFQYGEYIGEATNNVAEYRAFLASLSWLVGFLKKNSVERVEWWLDSNLVVQQLQRLWKIKDANLRLLAVKAWKDLDNLQVSYRLKHIPREENFEADALVNQALDHRLYQKVPKIKLESN